MTDQLDSLIAHAISVLTAASPSAKVAAAEAACAALASNVRHHPSEQLLPPKRPSRPEKPILTSPARVPKRKFGSVERRSALLHAIAHIEFNAIDLAFDMAARFAVKISDLGLDANAFIHDWFKVGGDEARHFGLIDRRLNELGFEYGSFPAHDGLWEAAEDTAESVLARLVVAPLILEARGLDVTPGMIDRLKTVGDQQSAEILSIIYHDEIGHVACGKRWFLAVCEGLKLEPAAAFRKTLQGYFAGELKPPFNHAARGAAGLPREFYDPI